MGMIINHNLSALNTFNKLSANNALMNKSLEKLSSGYRINTAADDAAGLAISEKMRGQIRGLDQAKSNSQDAISMTQTAEGALDETTSILQRMRELSVKASTDTLTDSNRTAVQDEMDALTSEINRIGNTTAFNTKNLLNGGGSKVTADKQTITRGGTAGDTAGFAQVTGSVAEVQGKYTLTVDSGATITAGSTVVVGGETFTAVSGSADASLGQFSIDGTADTAATATAQANSLAAAINSNSNLKARFGNVSAAAGVITLTEKAGEATGVKLTSKVIGTGTITDAESTQGKKEVQGKYTFNLDKAFSLVGDTLTIAGQALTAVASNADVANGQFNISDDPTKQAKEIAAAINANTNAALGGRFEATVKGDTITLTERKTKASGTDLAAGGIIDGGATSKQGVYNFDFAGITKDGGRITLDGVDIAVTTDSSNAGLADGKAMIAGTTMVEQINHLAVAINSNSALNQKYTATVTGDKLTLTQKTGKEALTGPVVTTNTTSADGFNATFQIGANTGQTMSLKINDMRADALTVSSKIAGDNITVLDSNGNAVTASYKQTSTVTDGTSDVNVEYSLDVSTSAKATAAISVIDQATSTVSAERSKMGAVINRLEHTINNLTTSSENLSSAESNIRDVDMASEMAKYTNKSVLNQAATAMLAKANQQPQQVLTLLQG